MTRTRTTTVTFAALLALAACSSDSEPEEVPTTDEETAPPTETEGEPTPTEDEEEGSTVLDFGQAATYDDGLSITVEPVETWIPEDYGDTEPYVLLETTFVNDSDTAVQIDTLFQGCTVDGVTNPDGYELFDGITTQWPNLIRGGGEATWTSACLVGDGTDLQIDMQVGDHPQTWWAGDVPE